MRDDADIVEIDNHCGEVTDVAYIQGNLAVEKRSGQKVRVRETKKVVYRRTTIPMQEKLLYLFTIAVCVIVAGMIIWRYAQIYEMNTKIEQIERDIKALEMENRNLKLEVFELQNPKRLREMGEALGLRMSNEDAGSAGVKSADNKVNIASNE